MSSGGDNNDHPTQAYLMFALYALTLVWGLGRYRNGERRSVRSGLMIALLDFPIEWANETIGEFWTVEDRHTTHNIRAGFPIEVPLLFFLGGSTVTTLLPKSDSFGFLTRWVPAAGCGLGGVVGEWVFNRLGLMKWEDNWGKPHVFLLYSLGCLAIFRFYDLSERNQNRVLILLLVLAYLSYPKRAE